MEKLDKDKHSSLSLTKKTSFIKSAPSQAHPEDKTPTGFSGKSGFGGKSRGKGPSPDPGPTPEQWRPSNWLDL